MDRNWYENGIDVRKLVEKLRKLLDAVSNGESQPRNQFHDAHEVLDYIHKKYDQKIQSPTIKQRDITIRNQISNALKEQCGLEINVNEEQSMDQFIQTLCENVKTLKNEINQLKNRIKSIENDLGIQLNLEVPQQQIKNQFDLIASKLKQLKTFETKVKEGEGERSQLNPLEHYDTVIKAETFKELMYEGWPIYKQIDNKNIPQCSVVTVIGNFGKGKSFIVKYLSGQEIAIGHNIHTEGPSCIYPRDEKNPVTFLDTAGFGEPLRIKVEMAKLEKFKKNRKMNITNSKGIMTIEEDQKKGNNNDFDQETMDLLKDKQYVEDFLQRFLLETSNFILVIVAQLTFQDQKLIKRILNEYMSKKKIFIVHNLYNFYTIEDVKKTIKSDIEDVFDVNKVIIPTTSADKANTNRDYYVSKLCKSDSADFAHVVMAREGTEAGNYYNESAKELILAMVKVCNPKLFTLEDALKEYIKKNMANYLENITSSECLIEETKDDSKNVQISDYVKSSGISISPVGFIKLKAPDENIEFKKLSFDDFGFLTFYHGTNEKISLPYKFTENSNCLNLMIEIPGFKEETILENINLKDNYSGEGFFFEIDGKKEDFLRPDDQSLKTIYSNIINGEIRFHTVIAGKQDQIKEFVDIEAPEVSYENGILTYTWKKRAKKMQPVMKSKKL